MDRQFVIMGDTDSSYVHIGKLAKQHGITLDDSKAEILSDQIQKILQERLANVIAGKLLTDSDRIKILEPGRETVSTSGLFKSAKKRYAIHAVRDGSKVIDKIKITGLEIKRSDTPKVIQDFLLELVKMILKENADRERIDKEIDAFREKFHQMPPWEVGIPSRATKVDDPSATHYVAKAAFNTNRLIQMHDEKRWIPIMNGDKVAVIYLKENQYRMKYVACRTREKYVPDWFKKLPFDMKTMEQKLIDVKVQNVIGDSMGWDMTPRKTYAVETDSDFFK